MVVGQKNLATDSTDNTDKKSAWQLARLLSVFHPCYLWLNFFVLFLRQGRDA